MILQEWELLEHSLGVTPLLLEFFGASHPVVIDAQSQRASLGFFTPAVEPGWAASALGSESCEGAAPPRIDPHPVSGCCLYASAGADTRSDASIGVD